MRKALWILMSVAFVDMLGFAMIFPLLPFYALRLGGQAWIVGPLVASFSIAQLASSPLWGRVSDRYGRRPASRKIPVIPLMRDEALAAFETWKTQAGRVNY